MPQLTFPIDPDGLIVPALVGLDGYTMTTLVRAGQLVPTPIRVRAILDTGADVVCVSPSILKQLGIVSSRHTQTHTSGGQAQANLVEISLSILGPSGHVGPTIVQPDVVAMELPQPIPGIDVLIG